MIVLPDREIFARAEVDAAQKDLLDCQERFDIACDAYMAAGHAAAKAKAREEAALRAWFDAALPPVAEGPDKFKALLISNRHLHQLLGELRNAAKDVLMAYERGGYGEKTSTHMALRAAIAKAEESSP